MSSLAPWMVPFLIGLSATVAAIIGAHWAGMANSRATYTTTLIAIALFYIVFAIEHGSPSTIIINILIAGGFIALALLGQRFSIFLVAIGLLGHGLFDVMYHASGDSPAPSWWAPLCLAVDVALGGYLLWRLYVAREKMTD